MPGLSRRSRYRRPRRLISWRALIVGLILGIAGGVAIGWYFAPVQEFDTAPWQLKADDKAEYVVAVVLNWSHDSNLGAAIDRLIALQLPGSDPIQQVADVACDLARSGYVDSNSGLRAVQTLIQFYQLQGRTGCASTLLPPSTPQGDITIVPPTLTPSVPPPPTKTPTPAEIAPTQPTLTAVPTQPIISLPTSEPQHDFAIVNINTYCDTQLSGLIEVYVQDFKGNGVPGQIVRVRWDNGEDTFVTGLKPERGPAYADFQMEAGKSYVIDMPGHADPSRNPLAAVPCNTEAGAQAITSYRVVFRPIG
jgi:hypothetical protein